MECSSVAMTVLEDNSPSIMSSSLGGDRYITPEYLAPLPQVIKNTFGNFFFYVTCLFIAFAVSCQGFILLLAKRHYTGTSH